MVNNTDNKFIEKLSNLQEYTGSRYKFITLGDIRNALEEVIKEYDLNYEDLFGVPIGIDPVEFDKAMKHAREEWLKKK